MTKDEQDNDKIRSNWVCRDTEALEKLVIEPELKNAIAQIKSNERQNVASEFLKQLKGMGISDREIEQQLSLSSCEAKYMTTDDVTKLATYTYHHHLALFQSVLVERPTIVRFLSNSLVGIVLGAMAMNWLGNRRSM